MPDVHMEWRAQEQHSMGVRDMGSGARHTITTCLLAFLVPLALTQYPIFPGNHVYLNKASVLRWAGGLGNLTRLAIKVLLELLPTKHYSVKLDQSRTKKATNCHSHGICFVVG